MIQSKTVDITPMKITLPVIEMSQYDLGREIIIHMKDGSDWFDLTGYTAKLQGTKPSGFGYTVDGVVDGHDITFASNYDMTSEAGFIPSEVRLTKDGVSLGSLNVILHVEKTPHDVTTTDGSPETIIPEMTELVERAEAAAEVLLDCSAIATTLPAGSSATASYDVDNGVFHFGIPRGNKGETGDTGETGNGIASITKTGTSGLVDTYTIAYTDGTSTQFTVTNGRNGTGSVADVWQNGVSVLDGSTAKVTVPTKTSDITNDSGYITSSALPTKVSDLTNDAGYISTETDPTVPSWAKASSKPSYTATEVSCTDSSGGTSNVQAELEVSQQMWDESAVPLTDLNDVPFDGVRRVQFFTHTNQTLNIPTAGSYGGGIMFYTSANFATQLCIANDFTRTPYMRHKNASGWTPWSAVGGTIVLSVASFSSLPQTISDDRITNLHVCMKAELGTPSAQTGDWTVTTSDGSLTISGSISGSTTATLYLTRKESDTLNG